MRIPVLVAVVACALACGESRPAVLREDVYVWQRAWTPAVREAVKTRGPSFDALRVLAAEIEGDRLVSTDASTGAFTGAVIPVIRVDGAHLVDAAALPEQVRAVVASFTSRGVDVRAVEIDHDCAASRLGAYADALRAVKRAVAPLPVSITALPSWAPSPALDDVMGAVDSVTLQVHAVDRAEDGLFSVKRARAAIEAFAKRARTPFFVSLPAYGAGLGVDARGDVIGVESEEPRALGPRLREVWAEPEDVLALLRTLRATHPKRLEGVVWFRLPVDGDRRAWSAPTLQAVRAGVLEPRVSARIEGADLIVENTGNVDVTLPAHIEVRAVNVAAADGARGYAWDGRGFRLSPESTPPRLRAGETLTVGWVRAPEVHVDAQLPLR